MATSQACADAFKAAGLATPKDIIAQGITLGSTALLNSTSNNASLGISEPNRIEFAGTDKAAVTFRPAYNGRPTIVFSHRAFDQRGWNGIFSYGTDETVIHEFIHAANVGKHEGIVGHDLVGYKHYFNIINSCIMDQYRRKTSVDSDLKH